MTGPLDVDWLNRVVTISDLAMEPAPAVYEHEAGGTGPWYQAIARQVAGTPDPPGDDGPCQRCGLDPDTDPACGCDPDEETFPSPWIWTDDGTSPGPGRIDL